MKKYGKWLLILLFAATIVLALLPRGVEMHFAAAPEEGIPYYITYASYFSLLPFGYGNFGPFITAMLTVVLFLLAIIYALKSYKKLLKVIVIMVIINVGISLAPLIIGSFTVIGGLITVMLATASVLADLLYQIGGKENETV